MNWLKTNNHGRTNQTVWSLALLIGVAMTSAVPKSNAQALQKGISVELAPTSSAVPVPDADWQDALIVTVTESGKIYFGIDLVAPDSLAQELKDHKSPAQKIYLKADARAPYASVVKVVDAARSAGVTGVTLLTTQPKTTQARPVLPEGIEIELARRVPDAAGK